PGTRRAARTCDVARLERRPFTVDHGYAVAAAPTHALAAAEGRRGHPQFRRDPRRVQRRLGHGPGPARSLRHAAPGDAAAAQRRWSHLARGAAGAGVRALARGPSPLVRQGSGPEGTRSTAVRGLPAL